MPTLKRITLDPAVMGGKACIRGLRVTVSTVLGLLAAGRTRDEVLQAYPYLEREDIESGVGVGAYLSMPASPTQAACKSNRMHSI